MLMIGCGVSLMRPFNDAVEVREQLEEAHGTQEDYRPAPDGSIPAESIERFLMVREALFAECAGMSQIFDHFEAMDDMEDSASGSEKFHMILGTVKQATKLPATIGNYSTLRNSALLENDMGLGEYTYIYAISYFTLLGREALGEDMEINGEETTDRVRRTLREMLRHQLEDLRAAGTDPDLEITLRDEILRLEEDQDSLPWETGPPLQAEESLKPYLLRIDALWCDATSPFDLTVTQKGNRGFSITTN
jgi:hypothetical protein